MARTATFGADNKIISVYDSIKAAKAAHKGQKDILFVTENTFAEQTKELELMDTEGNVYTVETLFPPVVKAEKPKKEKKEKVEGEAGSRTVTKLEGEYHVVKDNGVRYSVEDQRGAAHEALCANTTFEAYLAAAPAEIVFTTSRGATLKQKPEAWARYALRRGWIKLGAAPVQCDEDQGEEAAA